jgi:hypothetical protein
VAAAGGRVGFSFNQCGADRFQNSRQIPIDIAIPKSKHFEITASKIFVAYLVSEPMSIDVMLAAIDLNNKPILKTNKIYNKPVPRRLTAKVETFIAPAAKMIPDFHLLRR